MYFSNVSGSSDVERIIVKVIKPYLFDSIRNSVHFPRKANDINDLLCYFVETPAPVFLY